MFVIESMIEMIQVCESKTEFGYTVEMSVYTNPSSRYTEVIRNCEQKAYITACIYEFWRHAKKWGLIA